MGFKGGKMIGDKIIIREKDIKNARYLLPKILELPKRSIITIGGGSGTSKSELAVCIQEQLYENSITSLRISLDDYYKTHFNNRNEQREKQGIENTVGVNEINWIKVMAIIDRYKRKKKIQLQEVNKYTNSYVYETLESAGIDYLIIEGLYANFLKLYEASNLAVHLKGSPRQTLAFRKRRAKEDEENEFRRRIVEAEYKVVLKLRKYANVIL